MLTQWIFFHTLFSVLRHFVRYDSRILFKAKGHSHITHERCEYSYEREEGYMFTWCGHYVIGTLGWLSVGWLSITSFNRCKTSIKLLGKCTKTHRLNPYIQAAIYEKLRLRLSRSLEMNLRYYFRSRQFIPFFLCPVLITTLNSMTGREMAKFCFYAIM